jgi:DNA invertase Pin-like site-specific DNA recombinase
MEIQEEDEYEIVYCRVSKATQEYNSSLSSQNQIIKREFMENSEKKKTIVIYDVASARKLKNQVMLNEVLTTFFELQKQNENRTKVTLYVYHSSRFSRDKTEGIELLKNMQKHNILIKSATERELDSFEKWEKAVLKASEESDLISLRVKSGFEEKTRLGADYKKSGIKSGLFQRLWVEI